MSPPQAAVPRYKGRATRTIRRAWRSQTRLTRLDDIDKENRNRVFKGQQSNCRRDNRKMVARIYRPSKNAMQSGMGNSKLWRLEYEPESPKTFEHVMGYCGSSDMKQQIKLKFDSEEEAIAYCKRNGIAYKVMEEHRRKHRNRTYADNFRYGRKGTWTH